MGRRARVRNRKLRAKKRAFVSKEESSDIYPVKSSPTDEVLHLQNTTGNETVQRIFDSGSIQPKLKIGQPGDKYELEADRMAERVMRMPDSVCPGCVEKKKEEKIQPKSEHSASTEMSPDVESGIDSLREGGETLSESTRAYFEPRFGYDFSGVRVHTDSQAYQSAQSINSKAFTIGSDIVFNKGKYSPETKSGKNLLAHELTHVIQQKQLDTGIQRSPLTEEEKKEDLKSPKYAPDDRLQRAFDNDPLLTIGESGEPVKLIQEGLRDDGFDMPKSTKPSGEMDGGFGEETFYTVKKFQAKHGLRVDGIVGRETMGKLDELNLKFKFPPTHNWTPAVDRIDIIDSTEGRARCFEETDRYSNENVPGEYNNRETGEVTNVHQIHFHLDRGNTSQLIPYRYIDAIYTTGSLSYPHIGPDGPPPHEVCSPNEDKMAVADAPGKWSWGPFDRYPFKLDAHFYLMVTDKKGNRIAQAEYNVEIEKTDKDNIPNKVNRIYATKKRDFVRNRDL